MTVLEALPIRVQTVADQERRNRSMLRIGYVVVVVVGLLIGASRLSALANPFPLSFAVFVAGAALIAWRPILGIYLTLFFSVLGDTSTMYGYPFNLNFSSGESWLFIANGLTFTPIEVYLGITAMSWVAHMAGARDWRVLGRPLLWPIVIFGSLVFVGAAYGVGTGGDTRIAIWELRPLLYLVAIYLLASNLFTRTEHYVRLAWVVVASISIQNFFAIKYYFSLPAAEREGLETLTAHSTSVIYGWVFMLTLAVWVLRKCSWSARWLMLLASIPTAYVFVLSQRRAAVIAMAAAFPVFALVLFFRRRRAFFCVVPFVLVLTAVYTAAFWNASDGVGFGARAIKTVIASDEASERDASSNLYRDIENYDLNFTIRSTPITGVGFGNEFYQPAPLPDISFFVFSEYIPHNQMLWIWLKMGFLGFVTTFFIIAATLRAGTRATMQLPTGNTLAVAVAATLGVVMFFVYAYVDIVWEPKASLFLGACIAACANMLRLHQSSISPDDLLDEIADDPPVRPRAPRPAYAPAPAPTPTDARARVPATVR